MSKLILMLVCILLATQVSAWGFETHRYICERAVIDVWGANAAFGCLVDRSIELKEELCRSLDEFDEIPYDECAEWLFKQDYIRPSDIPYTLFDDIEQHYDYSKCPIMRSRDERWICGNESERPAIDNARIWFERAKNASTLCERVYRFCIGGNYLADSFSPLYQVKHLDEKCHHALEDEIDKHITDGDLNWSVKEYCWFSHFEQRVGQRVAVRHYQAFAIKSWIMEDIILNLTAEGEKILNLPLVPKPSNVTISVTKIERQVTTTTVAVESSPKVEKDYGAKSSIAGMATVILMMMLVALVVYVILERI